MMMNYSIDFFFFWPLKGQKVSLTGLASSIIGGTTQYNHMHTKTLAYSLLFPTALLQQTHLHLAPPSSFIAGISNQFV